MVVGFLRPDFPDGERAGVIHRVLVNDAACRPTDLDKALIQESATALRAAVVNQKRHLERSDAVGDIPHHVALFEPNLSGGRVAVKEPNTPAAGSSTFQCLDDGFQGLNMIENAVDVLVVDGVAVARPVNCSVLGEMDA